MNPIDMLEGLCRPIGAPGREEDIRRALAQLLKPHVRSLEVDRMGNMQAWLGPEGGPRVMLDAHMDETAFIVQYIQEGGLVNIAPLGGIDPRVAPGSRVLVQTGPGRALPGMVGIAPPHVSRPAEREKAVPWEKLSVDLGFSSAKETEKAGVKVGSAGVLDNGMGRLGGNAFSARNLDDRAGCATLLALAERLAAEPPPVETVLNFSVAEEVGLRGATTASFALKPDLALVVECTMGDTPGLEPARQPARMGKGPAVTVADGRIIVPESIVESLEAAAERAGVQCQRKLPPYGGTNAGAIHLSRGGVPTGVVSIPTRYIHSPAEMLYLDDFSATVDLAASWMERVEDLL